MHLLPPQARMLPRLYTPAVLPAERANFDSKDAPFLDPSRGEIARPPLTS